MYTTRQNKGERDLQAAKRDRNAQTDLSVIAVRVGMENFFGTIDRC